MIIGDPSLSLIRDNTDLNVDLLSHFGEDNVDLAICAGHQYKIENFSNVDGMTMTADQITFTADTMKLPSSLSGYFTFDLLILATKSLKTAKKAVTLSLAYKCTNSMILPKQTPLELYLQKNKLENGQPKVMLVKDIKTLFANPAEVVCAI